LLAYTEVGANQEEAAEVVDLNAVVARVTQTLAALIADSGAIITAEHLPSLHAYEGHFISLFQNLIANAIKYRSEAAPRIQITVRNTGSFLLFAVADNGIGIAPEFHDKIFVAFKRLHGKHIPGTGIGLAICQRVAERYGGRIWVRSEVGNGSTFLFTLPVGLQAPAGLGEEEESFSGSNRQQASTSNGD
jgi:light-regulated signal transduction histidine kinase (bacteriophytochrome)